MVDPISGIGLASSIITIVEVGYKISKRTIEFSRLLGDLPPDLQSCKDLVDIIVRSSQRLQRTLPSAIGDEPVFGPPTELQIDLERLFGQCHETATSFHSLLASLETSGALSKAIKLARKEGTISQIRNRLDQHVLAILFVLGGNQSKSDTETRYHTPLFLKSYC